MLFEQRSGADDFPAWVVFARGALLLCAPLLFWHRAWCKERQRKGDLCLFCWFLSQWASAGQAVRQEQQQRGCRHKTLG